MIASPSQRWSSAVHDLFACARGRLPASFLERKLADIGLSAVKPLPNKDLPGFEKAIDLVNALVAGRPAPGGLRPDAAMDACFPADHATLGALKELAVEYIASMRPQKAKAKPAAPAGAPVEASAPAPDRRDSRGPRDNRGPRDDRGPRGDSRGPRDDRGPREYRERPAPAPMPPRPPRIAWEAWLSRHITVPAPAAAAAPVAPAVEAAPAPVADGAQPAVAPEGVPAPVAAPVPAAPVEVFVPPALLNWQVDADAKRQLARIRERVAQVLAAKTAGADPAAAIREVAFAVLRPPMPVRDDLRALIAEHLQAQGVQLTMAALYPPPPVAALKRDWENLLAARGPEDPSVAAAWKKLLDAHPEAKAKLESERARELDELLVRLGNAARAEGEDSPPARDLRGHIESRFSGVAERIAATLSQIRAAAEATAQAGRLVAERSWADPEVLAAIAALDGPSRERLDQQRRHELDELDRRFRAALKEHGPEGEATKAARERLAARFPAEGAQAAERMQRIKRGDDLAHQEQERRTAGRSLSSVHLGSAEHRLTRLKAQPGWRLVVAVAGGRGRGDGKGRRPGNAVGLLLAGALERGPVEAGWRAAECADLDQLDAAVQAVADRDGGVIGLPLADCGERLGESWADAVLALASLVALAVPRSGGLSVTVELPAWAEGIDRTALDAALAALGRELGCSLSVAIGTDHAVALAEALVWTWGGRREAEVARIRQSGLAGSCLLEPTPALRDSLASLAGGTLPLWPAWSGLLAEAAEDAGGLAECLLARVATRLAADAEAAIALHRHLTGLARGRITDAPRLARELAWLDANAGALRPRDRLRLDSSLIAAQAAGGGIDRATAARLIQRLADLREDLPAEVVETALHAAANAREAFDLEHAELFIAPWQRTETVGCGGRALFIRLAEERARIAAGEARWKDARKHLDRADEAAAKLADEQDRTIAQSRLSCLRVTVLADDPAASEAEVGAALSVMAGTAQPAAAAAELATTGIHSRRHAHHALLRAAVRRQDEVLCGSYLGRRSDWCDLREAPGAQICALRAVLLAASDADAARAQIGEAAERQGGEHAPTVARLSLHAAAVAAHLLGAAQPELRDRLTALRRERPATALAVAALEKALALHPDTKAALAEALPLLAR